VTFTKDDLNRVFIDTLTSRIIDEAKRRYGEGWEDRVNYLTRDFANRLFDEYLNDLK